MMKAGLLSKKMPGLNIILIFMLLVTILSFPLLFKITTHIPGFFSTNEPFAALWDSWRIKYSWRNNIPLKYASMVAYPFGFDLYASGYIPYLWIVWFYILSIFTTPILAWNIQVLLNLFFSAIFTYLLLLYLAKNRLSAILGSIIFAFCPYQFVRIWQHLGLTYNQWIPMALFTAILLREKDSRKNVFLFLISLLLVLSFDFSVMYFTVITVMTFFIYLFFYHWRIKLFKQRHLFESDLRYFKKVIIVGLFAFVILSPQFFTIIKNTLRFSSTTVASVFNPYRRSFEDLFTQSAKPLGYLLPAVVHPIFGKFTEQFVGSHLYGIIFTEHTLYLGWTPLVLAFVAFKRWRKRNEGQSPKSGDSPYRDDFYIGFFVFLAVVAWLFSQPPWWKIGPLKIYMPSFFMYKILPMYRAYCRFGIVLMLAVAVLAGFGLKFILERLKSNKTKIAVTILACGLVLFEFWNWPPYKVIDVSRVPAVYYWLKNQPKDTVIAEYPLDADSPNEMYKFYQTAHEKRIINGTIPGTYANRVAQTITKLSEPKTAGVLKWMGVKYTLVHRQGYQNTDLVSEVEELDRIPKNSGLKFVRSFPAQDCHREDIMCVQKTGPIDVYEVVASPIKPEVE